MTVTSEQRCRYKARSLAAKLGCEIEVERIFQGFANATITYWVNGPDYPYMTVAADGSHLRHDPLNGDHAACNWREVLDKVQTYAEDLCFFHLGLDPETTDAILYQQNCPVLRPWLDNMADHERGLVLADWLEENGNQAMGCQLRDALRKEMVTHPLLPKFHRFKIGQQWRHTTWTAGIVEVKRISKGSWFLNLGTADPTQRRTRFGTAREITADLATLFETGTLPGAEGRP